MEFLMDMCVFLRNFNSAAQLSSVKLIHVVQISMDYLMKTIKFAFLQDSAEFKELKEKAA